VDLNWFAGSLDDLRERFLPEGSVVIEEEVEEPQEIVIDGEPEKPADEFDETEQPISPSSETPVEDVTEPVEETISPEEQEEEPVPNDPGIPATNKNIPCLQSLFQVIFQKKSMKKADPEQSREWIEEVVYRDKKKN
jgi:hypothetical protein